jgi:hypothetical protein
LAVEDVAMRGFGLLLFWGPVFLVLVKMIVDIGRGWGRRRTLTVALLMASMVAGAILVAQDDRRIFGSTPP